MSGKERMVRRFSPEVERALEPGEGSVSAGHAMVLASRGKRMLLGASSAFMTKHYWVVVTDRRLLLFAMEGVGTRAVLERAVPLEAVRLRGYKRGLLTSKLHVDIAGTTVEFQFTAQFKADADGVAAALNAA